MPSIEVCLKRAKYLNRLGQMKISSRSYMVNNNCTEREVVLNFYCICKISEYLTNDDLLNCIVAFGDNTDSMLDDSTDSSDTDQQDVDERNVSNGKEKPVDKKNVVG